jgi:hypothetical protein
MSARKILLYSLLATPFLMLIWLTFATQWEWSFLMDDILYLQQMHKPGNFFSLWLEDFAKYWQTGRFTPAKSFFNLFFWRFLPENLLAFRINNFLVLMLSTAAVAGLLKRTLNIESKIVYLLPFVCLPLAKPLLETITFSTITETWVVFGIAWGSYFLASRPLLARLFFLIAACSKEPANFAFLTLALVAMYHRRFDRWLLLDLLLFGLLLTPALYVLQKGSYLQSYSLISTESLFFFIKGATKLVLFLSPLIAVLYFIPRAVKNVHSELIEFWLLFGLFYLALVAPRGAAGYLTIPVVFVWYSTLIFVFGQRLIGNQSFGRSHVSLLILFLLVSMTNLWLWDRLNDSINGPSRLLRSFLVDGRPRMIVVNGMEAAGQFNFEAKRLGVKIIAVQPHADQLQASADYPGEVTVIELTKYFSPVDADWLQSFLKLRAQEYRLEDYGTYKVFYWPALAALK